MSSNGFLDADLMCSNLDSYYALTDYSWPETPGATSQAGVYDCSNGAVALSSNTRSYGSRMPYSVADGTSSHSGVMRFHQEQPCNPGFPGSAADNPLLIGNSPRPESHSQNHAVVNGSASLFQRALSEDVYAAEALISQKKDRIIAVYVSESEVKLIDEEVKKVPFSGRVKFVRHCVEQHSESHYRKKFDECPANSRVSGQEKSAAATGETVTSQNDNLSFPVDIAFNPELTEEFPRSVNHSQNHAPVNGSGFRTRRTLPKDA